MIKALALAATLLAAPAALAQEPPASPPPPPAGGPPAMTPAMQAARDQMRTQCAADFAKYCPDAQGPARMQCMREHATEMSDGCKGAMQALMAARQAAGG